MANHLGGTTQSEGSHCRSFGRVSVVRPGMGYLWGSTGKILAV